MGRIVAVLTGFALLACSWWIADQNNADPAGEVSVDFLVAAPSALEQVLTAVYMGGDDARDRHVFVPDVQDPLAAVTWDRGTPCAGLPGIGQSLEPAPHWGVVDGPDHSTACLLSGRWRLADLVGQADDNLRVSLSNGHLRVEYTPPAELAAERVLDFDLRVRFPAEVESADPVASVSGDTVRWTGTQTLSVGAVLTASSRVIPLPQELTPWLIGTLALLTVAVGLVWPRPQPAPVAADAGDAAADTAERPTAQPRMTTGSRNSTSTVDPDPDSPWRPPS